MTFSRGIVYPGRPSDGAYENIEHVTAMSGGGAEIGTNGAELLGYGHRPHVDRDLDRSLLIRMSCSAALFV
jgi:hypothetical protein